MTMENFAGRTAVVMAGGNGIGRSICHALAAEGVNIVVADVQAEAAERVADEIRAGGGQAIAVTTDVSKLDQVQHLADTAYETFGKVDILCNNAGVTLRPMRAIWNVAYDDMKWMMDINLWGILNALNVFLPRMLAHEGRKHIVNTASMAVFTPVLGNAMYGLVKHGIDGLSEAIRLELALEDIGVTVLYPGLVSTDAPNNTRIIRSEEERKRDDATVPFQDYMAQKGGVEGVTQVKGRGGISAMGAGETTTPISPDRVGPMVVAAIRENKPYCMTHPAPAETIMGRAEKLVAASQPFE